MLAEISGCVGMLNSPPSVQGSWALKFMQLKLVVDLGKRREAPNAFGRIGRVHWVGAVLFPPQINNNALTNYYIKSRDILITFCKRES